MSVVCLSFSIFVLRLCRAWLVSSCLFVCLLLFPSRLHCHSTVRLQTSHFCSTGGWLPAAPSLETSLTVNAQLPASPSPHSFRQPVFPLNGYSWIQPSLSLILFRARKSNKVEARSMWMRSCYSKDHYTAPDGLSLLQTLFSLGVFSIVSCLVVLICVADGIMRGEKGRSI